MGGLLTSHRVMKEGALPAIIHAAAISREDQQHQIIEATLSFLKSLN